MKNMIVLQLCSYYTSSKVHKNLFIHLDKEIIQQIYVPIRNKGKIGLNNNQFKFGTIKFDKIWSWYHRILYSSKVAKAAKNIQKTLTNQPPNIIHAHTWFSDGGTAYLLNQKYNIPYVIAIRDTDLNLFYKKLPFKKKFGQKILLNSSQIIFISPAYKNELISLLPARLAQNVNEKSIIIPNGINEFWFKHLHLNSSIPEKQRFQLLFVGEITDRKNIERIIKSFIILKSKNNSFALNLVGFKNLRAYETMIKRKYGNIDGLCFIDKVINKNELLHYYRESDLFVMPSRTDTFGLVYLEALSQGLPIIYSKGQGVDGYFDQEKVGLKVKYDSTEEIIDAIENIYYNYENYIWSDTAFLDKFKWENISKTYKKLYSKNTSN